MHPKMTIVAACAAGFAAAPAIGGIGLQDFYVADAVGNFYAVDGQTLQASYMDTFDNTPLFNEMLYLGGDTMLLNSHGQLVEYNLGTGQEEVVFNATDYFGHGDYIFTSGLARTSSGEVFFSVNTLAQDPPGTYGATFNPNSRDFTLLDAFDPGIPGAYYDFHELSEGVYAGANWGAQRIDIVDMNASDITSSYNTGLEHVSFFEMDGALATMTIDGDLYWFDPSNGNLDYIGRIEGTTGSLAGADVPAPAPLAAFAIAALTTTRRRR